MSQPRNRQVIINLRGCMTQLNMTFNKWMVPRLRLAAMTPLLVWDVSRGECGAMLTGHFLVSNQVLSAARLVRLPVRSENETRIVNCRFSNCKISSVEAPITIGFLFVLVLFFCFFFLDSLFCQPTISFVSHS
jgi:hypothetical protein